MEHIEEMAEKVVSKLVLNKFNMIEISKTGAFETKSLKSKGNPTFPRNFDVKEASPFEILPPEKRA